MITLLSLATMRFIVSWYPTRDADSAPTTESIANDYACVDNNYRLTFHGLPTSRLSGAAFLSQDRSGVDFLDKDGAIVHLDRDGRSTVIARLPGAIDVTYNHSHGIGVFRTKTKLVAFGPNHSLKEVLAVTPKLRKIAHLALSPNGQVLAFATSTGLPYHPWSEYRDFEVWTLDLCTRKLRRMGDGGMPEWTSDGRALIVVTGYDGTARNGDRNTGREVVKINARTGQRRVLYRCGTSRLRAAVMLPGDSKLVVAEQLDHGRPPLYIYVIDVRRKKRVVTLSSKELPGVPEEVRLTIASD